MPTTEIAVCALKAGVNIGDDNDNASQIFKDFGSYLQQQDGMQQLYFGMQVESPQTLQLFVNWDSKGHHDAAQQGEQYGPTMGRTSAIFDLSSPPSLLHVDLKPEGGLTSALSAPVTEVATFYFDGAPPENAAEGVDKALNALVAEGHKLAGWAFGVTYEEFEKDGVKGKCGILTIGWESVDAHMEARKGQAFKDNIDSLRNGAKGIEMHHVQVMNFA